MSIPGFKLCQVELQKKHLIKILTLAKKSFGRRPQLLQIGQKGAMVSEKQRTEDIPVESILIDVDISTIAFLK